MSNTGDSKVIWALFVVAFVHAVAPMARSDTTGREPMRIIAVQDAAGQQLEAFEYAGTQVTRRSGPQGGVILESVYTLDGEGRPLSVVHTPLDGITLNSRAETFLYDGDGPLLGSLSGGCGCAGGSRTFAYRDPRNRITKRTTAAADPGERVTLEEFHYVEDYLPLQAVFEDHNSDSRVDDRLKEHWQRGATGILQLVESREHTDDPETGAYEVIIREPVDSAWVQVSRESHDASGRLIAREVYPNLAASGGGSPAAGSGYTTLYEYAASRDPDGTIRGETYVTVFPTGYREVRSWSIDAGHTYGEIGSTKTSLSYREDSPGGARINERVDFYSYLAEIGDYRLVSTTEPGGAVIDFAYDSANPHRLQSETRSAPGGLPGSSGHGAPFVTTYEYDASGRVWREYRNGPNGALIATTYAYDALGRMTAQTESAGTLSRTSEYLYNAFGEMILSRDPSQLVRVSLYDVDGQLEEEYACAYAGDLASFDRVNPPADSLFDQTKYEYHLVSGRVTHEKTAIVDVAPFSRDPGVFADRVNAYDSTGRWLLAATEPGLGVGTEYFYDHQGRVTSVMSPEGVVSTTAYDGRGQASGRIIGTLTQDELYTETKYTADGQVEQVINPDLSQVRYAYDEFGRRTSTERTSTAGGVPGLFSYTKYDDASRITREYTPGISDTVYDLDDYGRNWRTRRRAAMDTNDDDASDGVADEVLLSGYDVAGNIEISVSKLSSDPNTWTEGVDQVTNYAYTDLNDAEAVTLVNAGINEVIRYEYDAAGRRTAEVVAPTGAGDLNLRTQFTLDTAGRSIKVVDPEGQYFEQVYDSRGNSVRRTSYEDADGDGVGGTPRMQERSEYDVTGRMLRQMVMADAASTASGPDKSVDQVSEYAYDADGTLTMATVYRNGTAYPSYSTMLHDSIGRPEEEQDGFGNRIVTEYEPYTGRVAAREFIDGLTLTSRRLEYSYDNLGRMTAQTWADDPPRITAYTYDDADRVLAMTDAVGKVTEYEYDLLGRQVAVEEELSRVTEYAFDRIGRLTGHIAHDGGTKQTTEYRYDLAGRRTMILFPDHIDEINDVVQFAYDVAGRMTQKTDQRGVATTYAYDNRGLVTTRTTSGITPAVADTFEYDGLGRATRAHRLLGGADVSDVVSAYTDLGHLDFEEQKLFSASMAERLEFTTDQRGNVRVLAYPTATGASISYVYDDIDRAQSMTLNGTDTISYLRSGFDDDVQRDIFVNSGQNPLLRYHYELTPDRRSLNIINEVEPGTHNIVSASFLGLDEVGNRYRKRDAGRTSFDPVVTYSHDDLHRLTGAEYGEGTEEFSYDLLGNRIGLSEGDYGYVNTHLTIHSPTPVSFNYGSNNEANEYDKINGIVVDYDPAGNLIGDERGLGYAYDFENRLTKVFADANGDGAQAPSGEPTLTEYVYDALGRRIQSIDHTSGSPVTTRYVYDGQRVIAEYDEAMQIKRYFIDGPLYIDEHVLFVDKTGPTDRAYYYLLKDLYTVAGLVDDSGEVVEAYGYDAYGKVRMFRIEGQVADADRDGDVDMSDFECLQRCFSGDGNAIPAGCSAEEISQLDTDGDADIDAADMEVFLFCWGGPDWAIRATGDYDEDGLITAGELPGGVSDEENFVLCTQKSLPQDPQCDVFDFDGDGAITFYDYGTFAGLVGHDAGTPWSGCYVAQTASKIGNPYYFTGQRLDAVPLAGETFPAQLYHYRARWYDPVHGRFGQRDPAEYADGMSAYEYVTSKPTRLLDPTGTVVEAENIRAIIDVVFEAYAHQSRGDIAYRSAWPTIAAYLQRFEPKAVQGNNIYGTKQAIRNLFRIAYLSKGFSPGGNEMITKSNRFVYTCQEGWIDVGHYMTSAAGAYLFGERASVAAGIGVEVAQTLSFLNAVMGRGSIDGWASSAFSIEDLPSDLLGAKAGQDMRNKTVAIQYILTGQTPSVGLWSKIHILFTGELPPYDMDTRIGRDLHRLWAVDPDKPVAGGVLARKILEEDARTEGPFVNFTFDGKKTRRHSCLCDENGIPRHPKLPMLN